MSPDLETIALLSVLALIGIASVGFVWFVLSPMFERRGQRWKRLAIGLQWSLGVSFLLICCLAAASAKSSTHPLLYSGIGWIEATAPVAANFIQIKVNAKRKQRAKAAMVRDDEA